LCRNLLSNHAFLELPPGARGAMFSLWLEIADSTQRRVPDSTTWLSRRLGMRVTRPRLSGSFGRSSSRSSRGSSDDEARSHSPIRRHGWQR
jgi:hypothetical protein